MNRPTLTDRFGFIDPREQMHEERKEDYYFTS